MASGTDYKHLWDRYQSEGVPKNSKHSIAFLEIKI